MSRGSASGSPTSTRSSCRTPATTRCSRSRRSSTRTWRPSPRRWTGAEAFEYHTTLLLCFLLRLLSPAAAARAPRATAEVADLLVRVRLECAVQSTPHMIEPLARLGYASKALIYAIVGCLAV